MLNSDRTKVILLGPEHLSDQLSGNTVSVDGIALYRISALSRYAAIGL